VAGAVLMNLPVRMGMMRPRLEERMIVLGARDPANGGLSQRGGAQLPCPRDPCGSA